MRANGRWPDTDPTAVVFALVAELAQIERRADSLTRTWPKWTWATF